MPSNWYAEFMRLNGFDVEDPYFQEKRQAFTPEPLGKMFENDKDITDYFQSGGEYDKAAGDATGLWGNTLDLGLRASKGLVGGLVGAAGVVTDLADTAATEISDLTGFKKGGLFADATDSARNFRSQADEAVSEGMAMPKNDFTLANPLGNYEGAEGIGGFLKATGKTAQDIAYSGAEIGADMVGAAAAGWAMGGLGFQGGAAAELAEGAGLGAKALAYGKDVLSSNVAKGFQMSGFADMYESHTQGDGDSRLKAAAIAAPYAVTTGLLEGIGAIETFGAKTLSKYLVKDSAANWVGRRAAAGVLGAMAEGGTEYPQQWLQIVAEELPSNSVNDKDPLSAWKRITDRSPEAWQAALGGALFGGPVGMITGLETVHKADAKALEAGSATDPKPKTPDEAVADIVGGVKTPVNIAMKNASDSLLDMSDDLVTNDKEAIGSAQMVADASVKALENREKLEQKVRQEIVGDAAAENAIIQTAPEEHIVSLLGGVTNSIDSLVARDLAQFDNINLGWQNFMASVASGQPTDLGRPKNQFDDVNALAGVALEAGIDPQAMAKATAARFEQIGVDPSVFANGLSSVDLGAIRGQLEQELRQKYAEKSLPVVEAIEKARTPEVGSDVQNGIDTVKQLAGPQNSESSDYEKVLEFIKTVPMVTAKNLQDVLGLSRDKSRAMAARLEKEGLVGPQVGNKPLQVLMTQEEKQLPATEVMERRSPEPVDTPKESVAKRLLSYISDKIRSTVFTDEREAMTKTLSLEWMTKPFRLASPGSPTFEDLYSDDVDTLAAIKNVSSAATREEYIQRATEKIKSDAKVSDRFHDVVTAPFVSRMADLKTEHDRLSASVAGTSGSDGPHLQLATIKQSMAREVRNYRRQLVRQAIPPGIARSVHDAKMAALDSYMRASDALDMEKYGEVDQQKRERTKAAMGKRLFTEPINLRNSTDLSSESAPAAKIVGMWLYTNANPELSKKIVAKMLGEEGTIESDTQLANELARELSNDGLYESLVDEDAFTQRAFMESIVNQGKSISSPHGLYIALTQAGEDPAVAISTVAGLHAASLNNHARTGESLTTFWDRLSDHIMTAPEIAQKEAPGGLFVARGRKPIDNYSGTRLRDFARDAIYVLGRSFDSVKHSQSIVMQHEIMHAMHHSGLLRDIVGPEGLAAIEKVTGKLYNSDGSPIWNERTAERLATSWEIFLATQKAPNAETQSAFDAAKEFFRTYLNTVLNMFNKTFKRGDWDLTGDRGRPMQYATGKNSASENYGDLYQQLEANKPAIKALYRLVYAQPNSEAHMATGGLVGASSALMSEMSDIAGIDMSDVMTKTARRVGVEHGPFERKVVGWTPESDSPITKDQLSDSLGFQGMNPEDPLVIEALDKHDGNVGARLSNWSEPVERRTVPMMSSGIDKKKQKVAETLLKNGASLRPSQSAADWLQEVSDMLITDSKISPMYNNEEIDFTSVTGIKTLLTEFPRLTRRFIDYAKVNGNMAAINKALPFIGKANLRGIVTQWTKAEKNFANVLASLEGAVEHLGLPNVAMHINNMFSLSRWAGDITERVPMYYDEETQDWVIIPGSESWRNITNDLIAWQEAYFKAHGKEIPSKTMAQFSVKSQRDLRLWMLAQRELEVFEHSQKVVQEHMDAIAEWEQKVRDGKTTEERPAAPKIPHISEAAVTLAKNVKMVLEMTYGDDIKTLDMMSLRYSKWESDSKLVPLLKSKLITAKQYADMMSAGMRHVPFARVAELVKSSGAVNVNIDGSMYAVLDYLKQDLTFNVQDPLLAAIKSVQAVNILTQRQIAKNAIGKAVMESAPAGVPNGEFVVLHSKRKISKEEYDKLPDDQREEKQEKPAVAIGNQESKDSAKQYYQIVPATKDDIGEVLAQLRHRLQGLKGSKREEAEILMNGGIFAAYLEPNNPVYIRILDAEVAQAFYTMNNPQVLYATSAHAQMLGRTQKWFKGQYVTSPQFIFNQLFRDIPNAITRSKHGLRLSDIGRGIVASLQMSGFEDISSRMDKDGAAAGVSEDALKGFGPFGGLVSSVGPGGNMDVDLLIAASHDGANTQNARGLSSAFTAFYENMKKHGAVFPSFKNVIDATKTGDWAGVKDNALMLPKLVFSLPRAIMSVPASVLENGPRLAERRLMMDVDMTQYPEIMKRFPDRYKVDVNGQALAGYAGTLHRRAWEAAEKRLKADPNAIIAVEDLPIQYTAMNRDFDTRHITLPFDQKGKWTPTIDLFHVFFGPAMLDMYTTLKQIGNNTATQSVLDVIRSSEDVAKRKSKLNYNKRSVLGKEFTYTDEDGRALAMLIKAVGVITIPALAQALVYHDDDEWQAQSFTEKLGYYHIKTPWGGRLRIARGLGFMQLLFSDLPTAAILQFGDKDPQAMKKWLNRFFQSTPLGAVAAGPISYLSGDGAATAIKKGIGEWTPEIAKGTTEGLMFDYDTFRNKQVSYETGFSPQDPTRVKSERYNILANTIARIEGVQPSQARHQVESLFPGTKALIPWLANKGMEAAYGATGGLPADVEASNAPIYGQGTGGVVRIYSKSPFGVGNEFVQSLYKLDRKLTGYYNSAEKMPDTAKKIYEAGHPELKYRDLVHDAVEKINGYQDKVMELRKDGIAKNDNGLTEYDLNKLMTIQAMEVYRLFYGKLLGQ